jgi:hypothetical protein
MKKIYYLLAALTVLFTACQKQPNLAPAGAPFTVKMNLTLAASDYQLLPSSDYPSKTLSFDSLGDANTFIPVILTARDPQLGNGSTANVTFNLATPPIKAPDSTSATYTLMGSDYTDGYGDIEASGIPAFLKSKFPSPQANQLEILTYELYASGTDTRVTNSFLYTHGVWKQIYQVSPAQYTQAGEGKYDQFESSDNLVGDFNYFLKNDFSIADTAKAGDVEYVSYNYYASGNFEKVLALTFDGNNWGLSTSQATLPFIKANGVWTSNATVYYTLSNADCTLISQTTTIPLSATELGYVGKYDDFDSSWTTADLDTAMILILTTRFPTPKPNINYVVSYESYQGGSDVLTQLTFQYNGTAWVAI